MIRNSFVHIPGVGSRTEYRLWEEGIRTWDDFLDMGPQAMPGARGRAALEVVEQSIEALEAGDIRFFANALPPGEHWRLFDEFRGRAVCLDIETTGLGYESAITTIALYDGTEIRTYVSGENLRDFKDDIRQYDLVITYNGKCFDIPFIDNYFMMSMDHAHIDLRYVLHALGYVGGQKGCERELGIDRGDLDGVDGFFAVLLWHDYQTYGNDRALETLLAYNVEDTVNLQRLMLLAYNLKLAETPFEFTHRIAIPQQWPVNPFTPDLETIAMIRQRHGLDVGGAMPW